MKTIGNTMQQYRLDEELLERLSDLEHQQWANWAQSILKSETISEERKERWNTMFVNYEYLPDNIKEYDREYARKVMAIVKEYYK
jgi:hypothetical protein